MKLLHLDSSITGSASVTRQLSAGIVERLRRLQPDLELVRRDLVDQPLPYFTAETLAGVAVAPESQPVVKLAEARLDKQVLSEFMDADVVVIGAPMYNFGLPAQLKSWIDYLSVAGVTFRYTAQGPVGLAGGKRVFIASSRGGLYGPETPAAGAEHQLSHLQTVLRFFGITDITVVQAEGVKISPEDAAGALAAAQAEIAALGGPALGRAA